MQQSSITLIMFLLACAGIVLAITALTTTPAVAGNAYQSTFFNTATTSQAVTVSSSARIMATSSPYIRVWARVCNDSTSKVYINMNADKPATTGSIPLAANTCMDINDQNLYQGSVTATSTGVSSSITVAEYVL